VSNHKSLLLPNKTESRIESKAESKERQKSKDKSLEKRSTGLTQTQKKRPEQKSPLQFKSTEKGNPWTDKKQDSSLTQNNWQTSQVTASDSDYL
jgi:hypothetical protein